MYVLSDVIHLKSCYFPLSNEYKKAWSFKGEELVYFRERTALKPSPPRPIENI
jgi:hypothetical protein